MDFIKEIEKLWLHQLFLILPLSTPHLCLDVWHVPDIYQALLSLISPVAHSSAFNWHRPSWHTWPIISFSQTTTPYYLLHLSACSLTLTGKDFFFWTNLIGSACLCLYLDYSPCCSWTLTDILSAGLWTACSPCTQYFHRHIHLLELQKEEWDMS